MGKILFSVSYEIRPEHRDEYFKTMKKIKEFVKESTGLEYTVYEDKDRPNLVSEVFQLDDESKFDKVKEIQEGKADSLFSHLEEFMVDPSVVAIRKFVESV